MSEEQLILLLKNGDHKAFTSLYNQHRRHAYNFCGLYVSKENAEGIVQEVFIKVWTGRTQIDENKNFKGYLFIITRNEIFDFYRSKQISDYQILPLIAVIEDAYEDTEENLCTDDLRNYIEALVDKLPTQSKIIFIMSRKKHLTNQEISDKLQISIKAVEAGITRALKFLRKNMEMIVLFMLS